MTRLTYSDALTVARDPDSASSVALLEARRTLANTLDDAALALARVREEMRSRTAYPMEAAE